MLDKLFNRHSSLLEWQALAGCMRCACEEVCLRTAADMRQAHSMRCHSKPMQCATASATGCLRQILAYVNRVRDVCCDVDNEAFTLADVEANDVRCPDQEAAKAMYKGAPCAAVSRCMGLCSVVSSAQQVCKQCSDQ